ncbi:MAG: isoprenylcysteine carboxylmethyltransferase family protein [Candidatus Eisenbacteria bacterium]|nr:isoprenylcysteine carboxylmethyltransferase family protein [Candidatus Eisenbacteria bacterium]
MITPTNDHPAVIVHPPFLYLGALALLVALHLAVPMPIVGSRVLFIPGFALMMVGVALVGWGRRTMRAGGTNINPKEPAIVIVSGGPFRFTRNPLYVGISLIFVGATLVLNEWIGVSLFVMIVMVMHFGVVLREERYLEAKFGRPYLEYKARVRRWI